MSTNNIEAARAAFSKFERDLAKRGARDDLREGLDYALDIIEDMHSDAQDKRVARNLIYTYRRMLLEKISVEINDSGSFEADYYLYWISLVSVFEEAGYDEDKKLSQVKLGLMKKVYKTLSQADRSSLLRELQRDVDGK